MLDRNPIIGHQCLLIAAFLMIVFMLTSVSVSANPKILNYSWPGNVGPLNPHLYSPNQMFAQAMVYEPLIRYVGKGRLIPWLAKSWEISSDHLTYTFHLREDVLFADGTPFDAQAVKLNIDAILRNKDRHAWLGSISLISKVQVIDAHTIALVLKEPYYGILSDLALVRPFRFLSPAAFPDSGNTAEGIKAAVGTGPWKRVESKLGEYERFRVNEKYWGKKPLIQGVDVKVISDSNTRVVALETGMIDLIYGDDQISPDMFKRFSNDPRFVTGVSAPMATRAVALNSGRGPTQELAVRQAILHAVNKDAIIKGIFSETEVKADTLLHADNAYCDLGLPPYDYDPDKAIALLASAGWKQDSGSPYRSKNGALLALEFVFIGKSSIEKAIAEVTQANLLKIGIKVKLKGLEEDIFIKEQKAGGFHLTTNNTWGPPYEPHAYLGSMRLPSHADYQTQVGLPMKGEIDDTIGKILQSTDEKDRQERYRWVLTTLHEQAVYLPISYNGGFFVHGPGLTNVSYGPTKEEIPFAEMEKQ